MLITSTAVSFILLSLGLAFCGWRFFEAFKRVNGNETKSKSGLLLVLCFFATAFHNGILGFGALFFATNSNLLYFVSITAHLSLSILAIVSIYTAYYIFLPKAHPYFAIAATTILSLVGLKNALMVRTQPFITPQNGIEWNMSSTHQLITFYLLFISLSTFFYIFLKLFKDAKVKEIKFISFGISFSALLGIVNTFIRLVVLQNASASFRTNTLDVGIGIIATILLVTLIIIPLVWKAVNDRKKAKVIKK